MSSEAVILDEAHGREMAARGDYSFETADDLAAFEEPWRALEERGTATPYQRFDWVSAFTRAGVDGVRDVRVVLVRDAGGRPVLLLPLAVTRRAGVAVAAPIGGKHANFQIPLTCRTLAARLGAAEQRKLLVAAGRSLGIDAFDIPYVPRVWDGAPVALASLGRPSPSNAYGVTIEGDPDEAVRKAMSTEGRRKLRNKERAIGKIGEVAFLRATTEADVDHVLGAFFRQKSDRFREQGIRDPFAGAATDFIRAASLAGLAGGRPAIELSAITLDGRVIAAFGAASDASRTSGMFISFEPEFGRYSPGDQLVAKVVANSAERGRRVFDLGVGEAEYKHRFCREAEELVDVLLPVTAAGRLYVEAWQSATELKRMVKQSEPAMKAVRALRRLRARLGG